MGVPTFRASHLAPKARTLLGLVTYPYPGPRQASGPSAFPFPAEIRPNRANWIFPLKPTFLTKKASSSLVWAIALLAAVVLAAFVFMVRSEAEGLVDSQIEAQARSMGETFREKLSSELRRSARPDDPSIWSELDPEIEDHYLGLPNLYGITIRAPNGTPLAVVGPPMRGVAPVMPPSDGTVGVVLGRRSGSRLPVTAAFVVPSSGTPGRAVYAEVFLLFDLTEAMWDGFNGFVILAVCVVGLLIYALAVIAYFIREAQFNAEGRSRERFVRLHAIGQVAAGLAHEIRNPLNAINLSVQVIERALRRGETDPRERDFARISNEVGKIRKVADSFVRFTRVGDLTLDMIDIGHLMTERIEAAQATAQDAHVKLSAETMKSLSIEGDREKLGEAVAALLAHAIDRSRVETGGGEVRVALEGTADGAVITISDSATAPDEMELRRILDPIAASRGDGAGLALAMVRTVVECHGGTFTVTSGDPIGLVLAVRLPKRFS